MSVSIPDELHADLLEIRERTHIRISDWVRIGLEFVRSVGGDLATMRKAMKIATGQIAPTPPIAT